MAGCGDAGAAFGAGLRITAVLVAVFSLWLDWLPVQGFADARAPHPGLLDHARHLAPPVLTLALHQASLTMLAFRAGLHAELHRPHIVTAFARGAGFGHVRRLHAAPAALLPLAALAGGRMSGALAGAVLVETVFALPGLGRLVVKSAANRDHVVVVGLALCGIVVVMLGTLLADLLCASLDPRIRRWPAARSGFGCCCPWRWCRCWAGRVGCRWHRRGRGIGSAPMTWGAMCSGCSGGGR